MGTLLESLKRQIQLESVSNPIAEQLTDGTDDRIKDAMLEDLDMTILGAENDTSLDKVIESIPEYEEEDPEVEEEVEKAIEEASQFIQFNQ